MCSKRDNVGSLSSTGSCVTKEEVVLIIEFIVD